MRICTPVIGDVDSGALDFEFEWPHAPANDAIRGAISCSHIIGAHKDVLFVDMHFCDFGLALLKLYSLYFNKN